MSKGSQKIVVRFADATITAIGDYTSKRNLLTPGKPYTVSDFVRSAVSEKLKHLARGQKCRSVRAIKAEALVLETDRLLESNSLLLERTELHDDTR